ncbi:putative toxin-antitoxin system toxin component, PIN family [Candidatus Accumulibacter phosphatis]|uniref:PIN domain-containing protein n=1 Tax=Candidatus Accumulibacter phosphatis TaxID=327160 RepID=A0A5S4ENM0_9PROT|nr:putative toxin-antitoxin system toxin component, PIN family [Candidatus Accumulibacter phosphatis]TMQ76925.1 hypothetical protein ACCUM_3798 [Candidatus Accumulibacter phosphatis]
MRAVLDTNIVMDLLHFADPRTQALQRAIMRGTLRCFTDHPCLSELERVSAYPQFKLDTAAQRTLLERYRSFASACDSDSYQSEDYPLPRCRDSDDQKFLILALRCRADLLITRDRLLLKLARHRHLPVPCMIVTAKAASALLAG